MTPDIAAIRARAEALRLGTYGSNGLIDALMHAAGDDCVALCDQVEALAAALRVAADRLRRPKNPHDRAENALAIIDAALNGHQTADVGPGATNGDKTGQCPW